jgi:hypothetical protein
MKTRFVHILTAILSIVASDALGQRQIGPLGIQTGRGVYQVTGNYYLWGSGVLYFPVGKYQQDVDWRYQAFYQWSFTDLIPSNARVTQAKVQLTASREYAGAPSEFHFKIAATAYDLSNPPGNQDMFNAGDQWYIDFQDGQYGNNWRNRGMQQAQFYTRSVGTSGWQPDFTTTYEGPYPYNGVFLNQDYNIPGNPYYSVLRIYDS